MNDASLFARKLRDWRARVGQHGRMTQEALAGLLEVSVDAIGKYERSVSFIRGDLEHRLVDRLGWGRDEVLACREDWEARARPVENRRGYHLLDAAVLDRVYEGSWAAAARASIRMAEEELDALPPELAANETVFLPIYATYTAHWQAVMCGDRMVAKWTLPLLMPEDQARFRAGTLDESRLSLDRLRQPILPGTYFGYCPALVVRRGHEAASMLLLRSFVAFLEGLARRGVLLHGIGTVAVSVGGTQFCKDLGMVKIGHHGLDPAFGLWELPGKAMPGSIFGHRSSLLRRAYADAFPC